VPDRPRRSWRRWAWGIGSVCVVGAVAGTVIAETVGAGAAGYRTGVATTASVRSLLTVSGTVDPVQQATAAFGASGTVASVSVTMGQQVTAGETLATLVPTALQKDVTSAQAKLNSAEATLTSDESAQSSDVDPSSTSGSGEGSTSTDHSTSDGASGSGTLQKDQAAVVSAQQTTDADQQTAAADLADARTACGDTGTTASTSTATHGGTGSGTEAHTAADSSSSSTPSTTPSTPSTTPSTPTAEAAACTSALTKALTAQTTVATDQKAVTHAESTLAQLLASDASASEHDDSTGTTGSTGSSSGDHGASSTATDSAAQLATDQAAIDSDQASLIEAQQAMAAAQLTSPISGTVAAVDLAAGESVTAGSTSDVITVIDQDSFEATASLTSSQVPEVKVGDTAIVAVDGTDDPIHGTVTRVGPVDVGSSDTYPLVVALAAGTRGIFTGSTAQVEVVVRQARDVLVVPTSAVHTSSLGRSYVLTVHSGQETRTTVGVGVVGDIYTQITSGLRRGETVVLADLTEPVPTSSNTLFSRFGGTGGLGALGSGGAPVTFKFTPGGGASRQISVRG
jgi:multidrug efflux pump subunit AcrA (membrane-fusion protein)